MQQEKEQEELKQCTYMPDTRPPYDIQLSNRSNSAPRRSGSSVNSRRGSTRRRSSSTEPSRNTRNTRNGNTSSASKSSGSDLFYCLSVDDNEDVRDAKDSISLLYSNHSDSYQHAHSQKMKEDLYLPRQRMSR